MKLFLDIDYCTHIKDCRLMELRLYLEISYKPSKFPIERLLNFLLNPMFAISRIPYSHQLNTVFELKKILNNEE